MQVFIAYQTHICLKQDQLSVLHHYPLPQADDLNLVSQNNMTAFTNSFVGQQFGQAQRQVLLLVLPEVTHIAAGICGLARVNGPKRIKSHAWGWVDFCLYRQQESQAEFVRSQEPFAQKCLHVFFQFC